MSSRVYSSKFSNWISENQPKINYSFVLIGLLFLFIPTYLFLFNRVWQTESSSHGPLVLGIIFYLFWNKFDAFSINEQYQHPKIGYLLLIIGLFIYIIGRSQEILFLYVGSQIFILIGLILILFGGKTLKALWFPLFFIFFMIPFPAFVINALTMPMKVAVSIVTEQVLYLFNYPIAREGVMLHIGQYKLLVADACAGMQTLLTLEAIGLLYLNLVRSESILRNIVLGILIIPISFIANVLRVITLTLITYYFGNEAGQGFIHGFAGMFLFTIALLLIFSIDNLIQFFINRKIKSL